MRHRDEGLIRGIGTAGLTAAVINGVVGAGIFTLPAAVALQAGARAPLAYLLCAIVMAPIVLCFAEAGSRVPTSGGAYGTVAAAFGPAAGFVTGMLLIVSEILASGGLAAALADMAALSLPAMGGPAARILLIILIYAGLAWANLIGVRGTARLITGATIVKLLPLLGFLAIALWAVRLPPPPGATLPIPNAAGFGRALILTLFAFEGMETALMASGEVRTPNRTLPRALFGAMLFVLALYLGIQLGAQHLLGASLAQAQAPLAEAAGIVVPFFRPLLIATASLSTLAWMASDVLGTSRMLFAFGRDGILPAWLGRLHPATHVPARAVLAYVASCFLLAVTGSFLELVLLSSLAAIGVYFLACAAALVLHRRNIAQAGPPIRIAALPVFASAGMAAMAAMIAAAQWTEIAGLAVVVGGSLALHAVMRRAAPRAR